MSSEPPANVPPPSPAYLAQSIAPTIRGVTWMSVSLPIVFVLMRCYIRMFIRKVFGIDDYLIVIALALIIAYGSVIEVAVEKGLGRHVEYILAEAPQNAIPIALLGQVSQPLVIMSCALGKTSFSMTLLRIGTQKWMKYTLWFLVITMNILHVVVSILLFYRCEDPRVLWDTSVETTCWPVKIYLNLMYFIGAYSAATDFVLALFPWFMLWGLNMKKKEKFGVAFAMSLGVFASATAIVKCTKLSANSTSTDPTYDVGELLLWAGAENALILTAACVPTLRPLLRAIFPTTVRSSENSHPLKNISNNFNVFTPKNKAGQWSAIIETEVHHDQTSDNNSDRSILEHGAAGAQKSGGAHGQGAGPSRPTHIKKTTEFNVSYD